MKSFPFIVCLVIGVWVGYYMGIKKPVKPASSEVSSPKASTMELMESFQEENKVLLERLAELEAQVAELKTQLGSLPESEDLVDQVIEQVEDALSEELEAVEKQTPPL
ncbi:hypothetical protein F7C95_16595 [Opitutia bacterium ISCC 51]|nr:hypothetical protein F7C95_16595 [Opitutae bacterium ISCC 51]QXD27597.1 hypothetical protein GA003_16495 [Opitutae bacterium ISCC 52]